LILIVDDAAPWSAAVAAFLRHHGYRTAAAPDGRAALALAGAQPPDLVLLDLAMPGTDGAALLREMRAGGPPLADVPVVVVSGVVDAKVAAAVADLGVRHHLVKAQHSLGELLDAVREALPPGGAGPGSDPRRVG
jgi:CheY-like chemotaxis protein